MENGEQYVAVVSGWGGGSLWGGDVARRVNFLEQGGSGVGVRCTTASNPVWE